MKYLNRGESCAFLPGLIGFGVFEWKERIGQVGAA